jgi:hypothetical protein
MTKTINDVESLPSENMGEDQWAAINNYDYELYLQQERQKKKDYQEKRNEVKAVLDKQIAEQKQERAKI